MLDLSPIPDRFTPACVETTTCWCCGGVAAPWGVADFHKSCEDHRKAPLPPSGIPIRYHRCGSCGFVFTAAFEHFSHDDFKRHVYNDDYVLVDPDFVELRPRHNALMIADRLFPGNTSLRVLDYGGGNGLLAEVLRSRGMARSETYDPFYVDRGGRPAGRFDLVTAFEVLEHTTTPLETLREMRWFVDDSGMMLFSTLLQPENIDDFGIDWWYAAPRNGHVSLYSRAAMDALMGRLGMRWASFDAVLHVAYRKKLPRFAKHLEQ